MGDSDRPTEGRDLDDLREMIPRRKLLGSAAVVSIGGILISQSGSDQERDTKQLAQAETRFVDVARLINNEAIANPRASAGLHDEISRAVESVTAVLDQYSSDSPQTEQRVTALRTAIAYYNTLLPALDAGATLLGRVAGSERNVLDHSQPLEYDPGTAFDLGTFEESITRLAEEEQPPEAVTSKGRKLVPNQQRVVDALRSQRTVFDQHLTAQQTYLDTATTIEAGVRAHEQSEFELARTKLSTARDALSAGRPQIDATYSLSYDGLSLNQYATLLDLRREGVSKLLSVCDGSLSEQQRREGANTALNHFFEAHHIVRSR